MGGWVQLCSALAAPAAAVDAALAYCLSPGSHFESDRVCYWNTAGTLLVRYH